MESAIGQEEKMARDQTRERDLDLALAAELQAALLPKACPHDCPHQVAAARNRMYAGVGGDFYDFIRLNDDQIALVIGDVVGHGIRAALIMTQIMGFLRSASGMASRPTQIVAALNEMLVDLGDRVNSALPCSLLYGVIDAPTGSGFFVNAAHPIPLICDREKDTITHLGHSDLLVGIEEFEPSEICHTFVPGQRLVMFTDGILEASDPAHEQFGEARLERIVGECVGNDPDACAEAVFRAVEAFRRDSRQRDDETIVVIDRV